MNVFRAKDSANCSSVSGNSYRAYITNKSIPGFHQIGERSGKSELIDEIPSKGCWRCSKTALRKLGPAMTRRQFYLAGGTALATYFGHRHSVDLDWFTGKQIEDPLRLAQEIRDERIPFKTASIERGTLYGTVSGIRVSLLEYRYPLLRPLAPCPGFACLMASMEDIACMKLSAVAQRGSKKDFVDIYALALRHFP